MFLFGEISFDLSNWGYMLIIKKLPISLRSKYFEANRMLQIK